jgi:MFS family permease
MPSHRSLAGNHDFTVLWTGEVVSQLGTATSMFVFPLVGYALTGSAALAGLPVAALTLGTATALLAGGVLADRCDRRLVMRAASGGGALLYGSLAVAGAFGALSMTHLLAVAFGTGLATGVFAPAEASAVRSVVSREELPTAISLNQARHHVATLLGGPVAGAAYGVSRVLPFALNAATFAISFVTLGRLRTDLSASARADSTGRRASLRSWGRDVGEGVRYVLRRPYFRTMVAFGACCNLVVNAVFFVAVLRLVEQGVHPASIGVVDAIAGVGGIVGAAAAPFLIDRMRTGRLTILVAWSWVPLIVPLLFWSSPVVVGVLLFAGLFLNPAGNAGAQSYRVAITPAHLQGRVASAGQFLGMSTMPLAPLVGGYLLEHHGSRTATLALLAAAVATALIPTLSAAVRAVPRPRDWPAGDDAAATAVAA